jgi:hypothetical protein
MNPPTRLATLGSVAPSGPVGLSGSPARAQKSGLRGQSGDSETQWGWRSVPAVPANLRNGVIGVSLAVVIAVAVALYASASHSSRGLATSETSPPFPSPTVVSSAPRHPGQTVLAPVPAGTAQVLVGQFPGEQVTMTVTKFVSTTESFGDASPPPGQHYAAAQFEIVNSGEVNYMDAPLTAASVVDSSGRTFPASIVEGVTAGSQLPASVTLVPGQRIFGYAVFLLPKSADATVVRYAVDSGYGTTGSWTVAPR